MIRLPPRSTRTDTLFPTRRSADLPSHGRWEAELGTHELKGLRVAVVPDLGGVTLEPGVEVHLRASAKALIEATGMVEVDVRPEPPNLAAHVTSIDPAPRADIDEIGRAQV